MRAQHIIVLFVALLVLVGVGAFAHDALRRQAVLENYVTSFIDQNITVDVGKSLYHEPMFTVDTTYTWKPNTYIVVPSDEKDPLLDQISKYRPTVHTTTRIPDAATNDSLLHYTDAYSYDAVGESMAVVTMLKYPKWILFARSSKKPVWKATDMRNCRIGVLNDASAKAAQAILSAYNIRKATNKWVSYKTADTMYEDLFNRGKLDVAVVFQTVHSPVVKALGQYQCNFVDYDNVDMQKLHIWLPYVRKELLELKGNTRNPKPGELNKVMTTIAVSIDTLVYGSKKIDNQNIDDIVDYVNQPSKNAFYTKFFKFNPNTIEAIRDFDMTVVRDMARETFVVGEPSNSNPDPYAVPPERDGKVYKTFDANLVGQYRYDATGDYYELVLPAEMPYSFRVGDRIRLTSQTHKQENGYYYVTKRSLSGVTTLTSVLVVKGKYKVATGNIMLPANHEFLEGDELWFEDVGVRAVMQYDSFRKVLSCKVRAKPASKNSGVYACYEDANIFDQKSCESTKDPFGKPKKAMTWDRPCQYDEDCPYFMANKNYYNTRGGCSNGTCEMPIGVTRSGYTKTDPKTTAYCYGCDSGTAPENCCKEQKSKGLMKSPDYAFDQDMADRA